MAIPWSRQRTQEAPYHDAHPGVYAITQSPAGATGVLAPPDAPDPAEQPRTAPTPAPQKAPERKPEPKKRHFYQNPWIMAPVVGVVAFAGVALADKGGDAYRYFTQKPAAERTVQADQHGQTSIGVPVLIDMTASGLPNADASKGTSTIPSEFVRQNAILTLEVDPAIAGELPDNLDNYLRRATEAYKFAENFFGRPLGETSKIRIAKHPTSGIRWGWADAYNPKKEDDWKGYPMSALSEDNDGDVHEWAHRFVAKYMPTDLKPLDEGTAQVIQNISWHARAEKGDVDLYDLGDSKIASHDRMFREGLPARLDSGLLHMDKRYLDAHGIGDYLWVLINQFQDRKTDATADKELISFWIKRHSDTNQKIGITDIKDGLRYIGLTDEQIWYIITTLKPGFEFNDYSISPP